MYWSIDWTSPEALASAKSQLHELIRPRPQPRLDRAMVDVERDAALAPRTAFIKQLIDQARAEDSSRLITSAIVTPFKKAADGHETATLDDPLGQFLDVLGYNEYIGWYMGKSTMRQATNGAIRWASR